MAEASWLYTIMLYFPFDILLSPRAQYCGINGTRVLFLIHFNGASCIHDTGDHGAHKGEPWKTNAEADTL
jgi:hypothetical protein